jgi:exopolysaccharide biosynthesis predicted pyruvyltransferase EpsI
VLYLGLINVTLFALTDCSPQRTIVSQSHAGNSLKQLPQQIRNLQQRNVRRASAIYNENRGFAIA